jgi:hypothetical protein
LIPWRSRLTDPTIKAILAILLFVLFFLTSINIAIYLQNSNALESKITNLKGRERTSKYLEYCPAVTLTYTEGISLRGVKNVTQYSATQSLQSSTATQ